MWGNYKLNDLAEKDRKKTEKDQKKTVINITNPNPPLLDAERTTSNPPALLLNVQFRNAGTFPANSFANLGEVYLEDDRSDISEESAVNAFNGYAISMRNTFPQQGPTLGPGEHTTQTLSRIFNDPAFVPKNILDIFGRHVLYVVVLAGYYDDNGYYHESHFCASIAWNQSLGFSQMSCKRFGDQY
jgi:hypothetical protein